VAILEVETSDGAEAVHVSLLGELDLSTVERLEDELRRVEEEAPELVVLDLRALTFLDSTGLRSIISADQRARRSDRRVVIVKGPDTVHRVFTITRLDERLDMVDDAPDPASA
jgi:anti-sigma B factor antagonist